MDLVYWVPMVPVDSAFVLGAIPSLPSLTGVLRVENQKFRVLPRFGFVHRNAGIIGQLWAEGGSNSRYPLQTRRLVRLISVGSRTGANRRDSPEPTGPCAAIPPLGAE